MNAVSHGADSRASHQAPGRGCIRPHHSNGSTCAGNFFFAGARMFFRSLDAAIFLFSRVARLPLGSAVVPAISTEERITLGAELADGSRLRGQNVISHPPTPRSKRIVEKDGTPATPESVAGQTQQRVVDLTWS